MTDNALRNESIGNSCIAQVIGEFGGGGAQRLAYNLALGMADEAGRSLAIALRATGNYGEAAPRGMELATLGANVRRPLSLVKAFFALRRLIRRSHIDLLHVHGAPSLPFVVLATRMMWPKPRLVFTWQDSESVLEKNNWRSRLMIWALRRCDAVSGSSRLVARKLADRAGLAKVGVFHGGVPISPDPGIKGAEVPMIVWVGRMVPPKDPQILIRAAATLHAEGLQFSVCIVGKPIPSTVWYMEQTQGLIERLGLRDKVRAPGFLSDDELRATLDRAEISVQTSHTEGMSIALMEHMMSRLSIVATDVGDTAMAIEDGVSGIIVEPRNEGQLTDALRRLLADPQMRARLATAARRRAVEQFSIQAMVSRAEAQYAELDG
jgi:glycosyltransferase involved in cell wall biosynthesis